MQAETPQESYYQQRCQAIGLTPEKNKLVTKEHKALENSPFIEYPLLCEDEKTGNVVIPVYGLDGHPVNYYKDNSGRLQNGKTKPFEIIRYKPGNEPKDKDGKPIKYHTPKGAKTLPWISPNIISDYGQGKKITTIVITEGYIKSISGFLNGLHIFGLSGIQNGKDKDTGTLHPAILEVIKTCQVDNVILLYDGDCNQISLNALNNGNDLYKRPAGFYSSAFNLKELLKDAASARHFDIYFSTINSKDLENNPKGLDDLFLEFKNDTKTITNELISLSKQKPYYFTRINITAGLYKVLNYLHINGVESFYQAHNQTIGDKAFVYHGTKYKYDFEKKEIQIIVPGAAKLYFRVGVNYYKHIKVPNKYGILEYQWVKWSVGTITQDHGKNILQHIAKYEAFCTKPDHENYQSVIDSCFNRYKPFEHDPGTSQECPEILNFFKHIFGEQYEIGLDYVQILYQKPTQMLPILCLVSRENNTGKSTFGKLLKAIFTGNMAIIGNSDLENDFNAGWADKLLICCEESFIDKKKTVEKIKSLSTGDKIQINQKGVDQVEIDFFGKFLFMSNNEENFVIANEHDERFWVRRVPKADTERTNLLDVMIEEIPNFLFYLNNRKLSTKKESRMHFAPALLRTEALKKLIEGNKSGAQKELTMLLRDLFMTSGFWELKYTLKHVCEELLRNKFEKNYIARLLNDMNYKASLTTQRFKYPEIKKVFENNQNTDKVIINQGFGKPYRFLADKFLSAEEIEYFYLSEDAIFLGQEEIVPKEVAERCLKNKQTALAINGTNGDLPF